MTPADFKQIKFRIKARQAPIMAEMANNAVNHFVKSFDNGGFTDGHLQPWPDRKWSKDNFGRALLIKSGTLKRGIRVKSVNSTLAVIGTGGIRYAAIHNYGLRGLAWGKYPFQMPKRQYIGKSTQLNKINLELIKKEVKKLFR